MTTNLETRNFFLPRDAQWANESLERAAILSRSDSFFESHCGASLAALEGVLLSLVTAPTYLIRGTCSFVTNVIQLNLSGAVIVLGSDLLATTQTLLFGALGVFYVALGILMPQTVFTVFEPIIHPPGENIDDVIEQRDTLRRELDAQQQAAEQETQGRELLQHQFDNLTNQFGEQNTALNQVREQFRGSQEENEQDLQGRVQNYNHLQVAHQELRNNHQQLIQERDGLNQNISDLTNTLGQGQQDLDQARQNLEEVPQERAQLQQEIQQTTEANTTLNEQLTTLREENEGLTATIEEAQQLKQQLERQEKTLDQISGLFQASQEDFQKIVESNRTEIEELRGSVQDYNQLQEERKELTKRHQQLTEEKEKLNQSSIEERQQSDLTIEDLSKKLETVEKANQEIFQAAEDVAKNIPRLKEQEELLKKVQEQYKASLEKVQALEKSNRDLEESNQELTSDYNQLNGRYSELETSKEVLESSFLENLDSGTVDASLVFWDDEGDAFTTPEKNTIASPPQTPRNKSYIQYLKQINEAPPSPVDSVDVLDEEEKTKILADLRSLKSTDENFSKTVELVIHCIDNGEKSVIEYNFAVGSETPISLWIDFSKPKKIQEFVFQLKIHSEKLNAGKREDEEMVVCSLTGMNFQPYEVDGEQEKKNVEEDLTSSIIEVAKPVLEKPQLSYAGALSAWLTEPNHPSKVHKYRTALNVYLEALKQEYQLDLNDVATKLQSSESVLAVKLKTLIYVMVTPESANLKYSDARSQYTDACVPALRDIIESEEYIGIQNLPKVQLTPEEQLIRNTVRNICMVRWAHCEMFPYLKEITDLTLGAYRSSVSQNETALSLTAENLAEVIRKENAEIKLAPSTVKKPKFALELQKLRGVFGNDFTATENVPNVQSHMVYEDNNQETFDVTYCRHGTPNIAGGGVGSALAGMAWRMLGYNSEEPTSGEYVAPDYLEFGSAARENNEAILFCSHQRLLPNKVENESDRVKYILGMQNTHENIFAFVQNVDGDLFEKKGEFAKIDKFSDLKDSIIHAFYHPDSTGCILPKVLGHPLLSHLLPDNLKDSEEEIRNHLLGWGGKPDVQGIDAFIQKVQSEEISLNLSEEGIKELKLLREAIHYRFNVLPQLLNDVHKIFFKEREKIQTKEQWQSFILAFFVFQKMDLKFRVRNLMEIMTKVKPKKIYYATPCKDFLDRGGDMAFVEGRIHDYMIGQENDPEILNDRRVNLIGPPIAVKKKEAIEHRIEPGLLFDQRLYKMKNKDKELLRSYRFEGGFKPISMTVKKPEGQSAIPTTCSARTKNEIFTFLKALQVSESFAWQEHRAVFEVPKDYLDEESQIYKKEDIFKQVNKDLTRAKTNVQVMVDETHYCGEERQDAEALFHYLLPKLDNNEQKALEVMALFHQGIGADLWGNLKKELNSEENGLGVYENNDAKSNVLRKYTLSTTNGIQINFSTQFLLKAEDLEKTLIYRDEPYANLEGHVKIDYTKREASWNWNILSVNDV